MEIPFNIFNRPNFGNPSTLVFDRFGASSTTAGTITSTRGNPRQLQLALRLAF